MHDLIRDITFSIGAAWLLGLLAQMFRQPILLADGPDAAREHAARS